MEKADLVLKSNSIFTGTGGPVFAGAVAVKNNRIIAVGSEADVKHWIGRKTNIRDFGERLIMPGIIDAHMHFFVGAFSCSSYMLMDLFNARTEQESVEMVVRFAKKNPNYKRITGMGWSQAFWPKRAPLPHRKSLDSIIPDKPVYLLSADAHTFWLNTPALKECGITENSRVSFGDIGRDKQNELSGLLFEIEAEAAANENAFKLPREEKKNIITNFLQDLSRYGITSTVNMSASPVLEKDFQEYEILGEIEKSDQLPVRLHLYPSLGMDTDLSVAANLRNNYCSEKLRVSGLKHFVDGVTSTYSAFLLSPYSDNPDTLGFSNYPKDFFRKTVTNANREGFGVRLHAIGDAAVRLALDVFEESLRVNGPGKYRNSIEHIESIHPDDIPRFKQTGTVASMQPLHLIYDRNEKVSRLGPERARYAWPFCSLLNAEAILAFGTDFPVVPANPFPNIQAAVNRLNPEGENVGVNPEESITLGQTLRAYTYGAACALNREKELGTLEPGKLADITVLDRNLFSGNYSDIAGTSVVLTVSDGRIVYDGIT